jgi:Methylamine utilisation protein MauE
MLIPTLSRILVAGILVAASCAKLLNLQWFTKKVAGYSNTGGFAATFLATLIVLAELGTGVWMASSVAKVLSGYCAVILIMLFTVVVAVNLGARKADECACIPFLPTLRLSWRLIARNVSLIVLAWLSTSPVSVHATSAFIFGMALFTFVSALVIDIAVAPARANGSLRGPVLGQ